MLVVFSDMVGDFQRFIHGGGSVADADGEEGGDARSVRGGENLGEVGVIVEMAVRIDQHTVPAFKYATAKCWGFSGLGSGVIEED